MGYFNIYILKKIINKLFNKKTLLFIVIFLLLLFIAKNSFCAFTLNSQINYIGFSSSDLQLVNNAITNFMANDTGTLDNLTLDGVFIIADNTDNTIPYKAYFYNRNLFGSLYLTYNNNQLCITGSSLTTTQRCRVVSIKTNGTYSSGTARLRYFPLINENTVGTNYNIYTNSSLNTIAYPDIENSRIPIQITNSSSNISNWNFNYLNIIGDDLYATNNQRTVDYALNCIINNSSTYTYNVTSYGYREDEAYNHFNYLNIPRNKILYNCNIQPNDTVQFILVQTLTSKLNGDTLTETYNLGTYTLTITSQQAQDINNQSDKTLAYDNTQAIEHQTEVIEQQTEVIEQQTDAINQTTDAVESLENTISDDTVTSSASDLPSVNVNDPSQNGINNIFQSIYNAFCTGQAQDIIFPIPFTNKNITLNPYYISNMLNNNGATWIYTLIQAFWGYLIGRYIVKDVSKKITKIKGGNIENLENENIKEDML